MATTSRSLIIFARYPRSGEVKTRLGKAIGMEAAAEVYRGFAEHSFALGAALQRGGVQVRVFHDSHRYVTEMQRWVGERFPLDVQEGGSLGVRMQNAFDRVFEDGTRQAVIIGTDVPELGEETVNRSFSMLASHDLVIGPSTDGGYYLLGMTSPVKDVFSGISWGSDSVLAGTLALADRIHLTVGLLPPLSDIDSGEDYRAYLARSARARGAVHGVAPAGWTDL